MGRRARAGGGRRELRHGRRPPFADAERELVEEFALFDNWVDRYQYIIDLGRQLPPYPEAEKTEEQKIKGCQSQVWLVTKAGGRPPRVFQAISDSAIVSGLIAILMRIYSGRPAGRSWPRRRASSPPSAWTST